MQFPNFLNFHEDPIKNNEMTPETNIDQLAKPIFRSRYVHTPFW